MSVTPRGASFEIPDASGPEGGSASANQRALILVVGANSADRGRTSRFLEREGFATLEAETPQAAERAMAATMIDLVIVEGRLGDGGVLGLCGRLGWSQAAPIILLSDEAEVTDRVIALEVGADDLIGKPFDDRELLARTRALLRRSRPSGRPSSPDAQSGGEATLNVHTRVLVGPSGARTALPWSQFALLRIFADCPGRLVTVEAALAALSLPASSSGLVRTNIARLRRKLAEAGFDPDRIVSVRAQGYMLDAATRIRITDSDVWAGPRSDRRSDHPGTQPRRAGPAGGQLAALPNA